MKIRNNSECKKTDLKHQSMIFNKITLSIALIALFIGLGTFIHYFTFEFKTKASYIKVTVDGEEEAVLFFGDQYEYEIRNEYGLNVITVDEDSVSVTHADCKDGYCVDMGEKYKVGDTIICLPHKLVITLLGEEKLEVDDVAK